MLGVSGLVFGCGGMPPPAEAPPAGSEPARAQTPPDETQSVQAAPAPAASPPAPAAEDALASQEELVRAERELAAADAELSGATAQSREEAEKPARAPGGEGADAKPKSSAAQQLCTTTCKAFASLLRARDAICRIDGSDGERCANANKIVERHSERTTACGCSG